MSEDGRHLHAGGGRRRSQRGRRQAPCRVQHPHGLRGAQANLRAPWINVDAPRTSWRTTTTSRVNVAIRAQINGHEVRRSYSICADPPPVRPAWPSRRTWAARLHVGQRAAGRR
ncbi:hypothetical protein QJS66_16505 [Kocuria rhizophila]|nr:hypothetical protein QJS66_16505 [Kocuria rhizophila]